MNILILSDTHGHADRIQSLLDRPSVRPDAILFAGDGLRDFQYLSLPCPLYSVMGNNDFICTAMQGELPKGELTLDFDGCRIFMTHGHRHGVKESTAHLLQYALSQKADIVIYGHTHEPYHEYIPVGEPIGDVVTTRPMWLFNPGSLGDWRGSFGSLEIRNGKTLLSFGKL
jgi:putative phosphoesterase